MSVLDSENADDHSLRWIWRIPWYVNNCSDSGVDDHRGQRGARDWDPHSTL